MLVSTYKTINIYLTSDGEFFCHIDNKHPGIYALRSLNSNTLEKLHKAIDNINTIDKSIPSQYYLIKPRLGTFKLLNVIRTAGNKIYCDDGVEYPRNSNLLFSKQIENHANFHALLFHLSLTAEMQEEITKLANKREAHIQSSEIIIKHFLNESNPKI